MIARVDEIAGEERKSAATRAIRHHYDVGNDFYGLWLDPTLSYSCAMPTVPTDTLDVAQQRKLRFHLDAVRADTARSVLDVGCGWGAILEQASVKYRVPRAVGLTLSAAQTRHIRELALRGVEVRTENWMDFAPDDGFDAIISIGAFEHFARPDDTPAEKDRNIPRLLLPVPHLAQHRRGVVAADHRLREHVPERRQFVHATGDLSRRRPSDVD